MTYALIRDLIALNGFVFEISGTLNKSAPEYGDVPLDVSPITAYNSLYVVLDFSEPSHARYPSGIELPAHCMMVPVGVVNLLVPAEFYTESV